MASQFGQDEYVLKLLDLGLGGARREMGYIVEAGAASPSHVSNSLLFLNRGYRLRLIEGDTVMSCEWKELTGDIKLQESYIPYANDAMDKILHQFDDLPTDFEALFLDINGGEWQLLKGMKKYRPKVVCVEYDNAYPLSIYYTPTFFGYSPETGQASAQAFHRMMAEKRYYFCKSFFQDHIYVSEEYLSAIISVEKDFKYGTSYYLETAHESLYAPEAVFCNQDESKPRAGINFYRDKIRALITDGHTVQASHMYSYVLSHALRSIDFVQKRRSPEYTAEYRIGVIELVREYSYLVNPLLNIKHQVDALQSNQ